MMGEGVSPVGCAWSADAASDTPCHTEDTTGPSCPLYRPGEEQRLIYTGNHTHTGKKDFLFPVSQAGSSDTPWNVGVHDGKKMEHRDKAEIKR